MRLLRPLLMSLALAAGPALAEPYQVEILLFRQSASLQPSRPVPEDWSRKATALSSADERTPMFETESNRLQATGAYSVISTRAWLQDVQPQAAVVSYSDGEIRDSHGLVDAVVSLQQLEHQKVAVDFKAWVNQFDANGFLAGSEKIAQQLQLMPGQLVYVDHPTLGALIRLRPQQ